MTLSWLGDCGTGDSGDTNPSDSQSEPESGKLGGKQKTRENFIFYDNYIVVDYVRQRSLLVLLAATLCLSLSLSTHTLFQSLFQLQA